MRSQVSCSCTHYLSHNNGFYVGPYYWLIAYKEFHQKHAIQQAYLRINNMRSQIPCAFGFDMSHNESIIHQYI